MKNGNFTASLGSRQNPGFLPLAERLQQIHPGENPFQAGNTALPENSPVFFGRAALLHRFQLTLCNDNPGHINLVGDPRIGKSSLLNQLKAVLAAEENLISICCNAQGLNRASQERFFTDLGEAVAEALSEQLAVPPADFDQLQSSVRRWAKSCGFVLLLDEFEVLADNPVFDVTFFNNLRSLGDNPENRFGFFIVSHEHIRTLCHTEAIHGSRFWNIFASWTLGLLEQAAASQLVERPLQHAGLALAATPEQLLNRYGCHPFLLQCALHEHTFAAQHGLAPDIRHLHRNLHNIMEDIWRRRNEKEVARLFEVIAEKAIPDDEITQNLEDRGLLVEGKLVCTDFAKALPEKFLPKKKSVDAYLQEIKKDPEKALNSAEVWLKYLDQIEKAVSFVGKMRKTFYQDDSPINE